MHRSHRLHYPGASRARFAALLITPLIIFGMTYVFVALYAPALSVDTGEGWGVVLAATFASAMRIGVAYVAALIVSVPLALLAARSRAFETVLLPVYDVFESIPNLAIYPLLLVVFLKIGFLEGAATIILAMNMVWNIVFALVGGLEIIPKDIINAAHVFGISGWSYIRRVVLPALVPQLVTGSILAVGQGWNIIVVTEVLHAYLPSASASQDLFGIGTILVAASARGDHTTYLVAFFVMIACIALFNVVVWQRLLRFSQRFKFD